ncbi:hypothetical protein [Streptomyces sp. NPDC046942]|uniref:hypothetical protein n=1 Tax=Streptomyces sp. NPDC046942 TaxID=3155137 RepID=UPI0034038AC9
MTEPDASPRELPDVRPPGQEAPGEAAAQAPFGNKVSCRLGVLFVVLAVIVMVWMFMMGAAPQGHATVRNWSSSWIGLDVGECLGLLATALAMRTRTPHLPAVAGASAALFAVDAWFDMMTALAGTDWYTAVTFALIAEIPLAAILATVSIRAARRT